jgi:hypothetical protein
VSDWIQRSIHRCADCGYFLNVKLIEGQGWVPCRCDRCGADAPDREALASQPLADNPDEVVSQALEDGSVAVVGIEGGWWLRFSDGGPAGARYSGGVLLSRDTQPPFPEGFHGFLSWAGDGLLIVDQDPINGTHHAHWVDASLPDEVRDIVEPWTDEAARVILAEQLYRSAYSRSTATWSPEQEPIEDRHK